MFLLVVSCVQFEVESSNAHLFKKLAFLKFSLFFSPSWESVQCRGGKYF